MNAVNAVRAGRQNRVVLVYHPLADLLAAPVRLAVPTAGRKEAADV